MADSPRRNARGVATIVPPQVVSDRSVIDSVAGFINDVTLANQPLGDPKDIITWARFESTADISDPRFGNDWVLEGNVSPPLLLILGYGLGVQMWAIPANGEAVEVLSWRHGIVTVLRILPTPSYAENGRADEPVDGYVDKRPLMAICDGTTPVGSQPQFCAVNFVSLKSGAQVKTIKFKNPVLDILANRSSIVITFHERIAVFDTRTLEDRLSVTTCYPSPGINPNPVALGSRWMAYSESKLIHSKRSGGGCEGDGVSSYTATVLNAAKSFGKGLRELGEHVAAGLTGTASGSGINFKNSSFDSSSGGDLKQPGVVTILDIRHSINDTSPTTGTPVSINGNEPIVAHFIAHSDAIVAMEFDNSGMMLLTADKRGHDFHLFRIQPHPVGSSLASVHHLYILHRGDTSSKVQNITFSLDSRWVAVSTLRGTTHVFPITPYGGPAGVRTHTSLHVVNKLSRFHRSAGLTADGRSSSPISHSDTSTFSQILMPYHNPTMPPFPRPTVVLPLAQLRQPFALGSPSGSAQNTSAYSKSSTSNSRQRLSSLSDDNGKPLSVCSIFAKSRSWLLDPPNVSREAPHKLQRKSVDSLFIMAGHGSLIQYDLDTNLASNIAKDKVSDDTPIELQVEAKAQWNLRRKDASQEIIPPLLADNWLVKDRSSCMLTDSTRQFDESEDGTDSWLSQVEIITHAGPHRRLWMGPQFVFKTYNTPSGSNLSHIDAEAVEIGVSAGGSGTNCRPGRSSPLNMPLSAAGRSTVPVLIESGSYSSIEQSPKLMDRFRHEHLDSDFVIAHGDNRLKEDLADAMRESPSISSSNKDTGLQQLSRRMVPAATIFSSSVPNVVGHALSSCSSSLSTPSAIASDLPNICSSGYYSKYESLDSILLEKKTKFSIEKVVNPLGTVTTITDGSSCFDEVVPQLSADDYVIHENCDESLFRPVIAIFCDEKTQINVESSGNKCDDDFDLRRPPEMIGNKLIVPVIEKEIDLELNKRQTHMKNAIKQQKQQQELSKFNRFSSLNKKPKSDLRKSINTNNDYVGKKLVDEVIKVPADCVAPLLKSGEPDIKRKDGKGESMNFNLNQEIFSGKPEKSSDLKRMTTLPSTSLNNQEKKHTKKDSIDENADSTNECKTKIIIGKTSKELELDQEPHRPHARALFNCKYSKKKVNHRNSLPQNSAESKYEIHCENEQLSIQSSGNSDLHENETLKTKDDYNDLDLASVKTQCPTNDVGQTGDCDFVDFADELLDLTAQLNTQKKRTSCNEFKSDINSERRHAKNHINKRQRAESLAQELNNSKIEIQSKLLDDNQRENIDSSERANQKNVDIITENLPNPIDRSQQKTRNLTTNIQAGSMVSKKKPKIEKVDIKLHRQLHPEEEILMRTQVDPEPISNFLKGNSQPQALERIFVGEDDDKCCADNKANELGNTVGQSEEIFIDSKMFNNDLNVSKAVIADHLMIDKGSTVDEVKQIDRDTEPSLLVVSDVLGKKNVKKGKSLKPQERQNCSSVGIFKKIKNSLDSNACNATLALDNVDGDPIKNKCVKSLLTHVPADEEIFTDVPDFDSKKEKNLMVEHLKSTCKPDLTQVSPDSSCSNESSISSIKKNSTDCLQFIEKFPEGTVNCEHTKCLETRSPWGNISSAADVALNITSEFDPDSNYPILSKKCTKGKKANTLDAALSGVCTFNAEDPTKYLSSSSLQEDLISKETKPYTKGKTRKAPQTLDNLEIFKPLEDLTTKCLPPLPVLQPINTDTESSQKAVNNEEQESLINFESPLQEITSNFLKQDRRADISPTPRGFSEKNLILALCGSLHFENENTARPDPDSPLNQSFSELHAQTERADQSSAQLIKTPNENDDQYMSLEQSSQENPSVSSSTSEEMTKTTIKRKQRRKKQILQQQVEKEQQQHLLDNNQDDDDELRPLISMSDSQLETYVESIVSHDQQFPHCTLALGRFEKEQTEIMPTLDNNQLSDSSLCGQKITNTSEDLEHSNDRNAMIQNSKLETTVDTCSDNSCPESGAAATDSICDTSGALISTSILQDKTSPIASNQALLQQQQQQSQPNPQNISKKKTKRRKR